MLNIDSKLTTLSQSLPELWELLTTEQQIQIAPYATIKLYKKNESIHSENDNPQDLMCLIDGKVKVVKEGASRKTTIVRIINSGEYFGYRAFFSQEPYKTAAVAFSDSYVCLIPMHIICDILKANTCLAMFFIRRLSKELGAADEKLVNLTQKHIRGRLAEALLTLQDTYGMEDDNCTLNIYLSREDLANLSNMTASNAIRTLSNFATEKLIIIDGRRIKLIDIEGLRKISITG